MTAKEDLEALLKHRNYCQYSALIHSTEVNFWTPSTLLKSALLIRPGNPYSKGRKKGGAFLLSGTRTPVWAVANKYMFEVIIMLTYSYCLTL